MLLTSFKIFPRIKAENTAPINVSYQATFDGTAADSVYLVFFNVMTKVMSINAGRIISII